MASDRAVNRRMERGEFFMKVLIICTEKLPVPPIRGGAIQTYIAGSVQSLSKDHQITILGITDPDLPEKETIAGIEYVRVPGKLLEIYREGIVHFLKDQTFDLIHIFNRPRLVIPVREVAPNARIVLSMHNDMFKLEKIEPEEAKKAIAQLDKIITISNYIGKAITELYPEAQSKLQTIYSGVDLERFIPAYTEKGKRIRESVRREHNLEGKKVILFAGRLSANKGADVLVRAIPELEKNHSNIALIIVGSKWFSQDDITDYVAYVRALAARMSVPVITTGFVAPEEIQNWFCAADIFVCPSQWQEPLARVHYEAMAAGLPIVTTARGGNPEVIEGGKNGFVVENPEDPHEFALHLAKLLSNPNLRNEMGQYGRKLAEEKYTWNRVVSNIASVWREMEQKIKNKIAIGSTNDATNEDLEAIATEAENELEMNAEMADVNSQLVIESGKEVLDGIIETNETKESGEMTEVLADAEEEIIETPPLKKIFICYNNPPAKPWLKVNKKEKSRKR